MTHTARDPRFVSGELRAIEMGGDAREASARGAPGALVAIMTGTMMTVRDRPGLVD